MKEEHRAATRKQCQLEGGNKPPSFFTMKKLFVLLFTAIAGTSCGPYKEISVSQISSAKMLKFDSKEIEMEVGIKIKNPNKFGFSIINSDVKAEVNGIKLGEVDLKDRIKVKRMSEDVHTLRLEAELSKVLAGGIFSLLPLLQQKNINLHLEGNIKVRAFGIVTKKYPVNVTQKIPLDKLK